MAKGEGGGGVGKIINIGVGWACVSNTLNCFGGQLLEL